MPKPKQVARDRVFAERLEPRVLLASIAPDLDFGVLGDAPTGGSLLVAPQAGGKILAVDSTSATRLNGDGSLDLSFNRSLVIGGQFVTSIRAAISGSRLIIGGIGGTTTISLAAKRLSDGGLDTTFGAGGLSGFNAAPAVSGSTIRSVSMHSIVSTPDGGLLVTTTQHLEPFELVNVIYKLDSDGDLDTDFGEGGALVVDADLIGISGAVSVRDVDSAADGKFLVSSRRALTRFLADGSIDTSFGDQGNVRGLNIGGFQAYSAIVARADGTILLSVDDPTDLFTYGRIVRLSADGDLDTTFGDGGEAGPGDIHGPSAIDDFVVDSAGRIVGISGGVLLVRFTPDGDLDTSLDDGRAILPREVKFGAVMVDASDRVIVGEADYITRFTERDRVLLTPDGLLRVDGTVGDDTLEASISGTNLNLTLNGDDFSFTAADVSELSIFLGIGDNDVEVLVDLDATIVTGRNHDSIVTGNGSNHIETGEGGNTVVSGNGDDTIIADSFAIVTSNGGDDDITILPSQEFFTQTVTVNGGDGDDHIRFTETQSSAKWTVNGGSGDDLIEVGNVVSAIFGEDGDDTILDGSGGDLIVGGAGNDSILGEDGMDRIDGGEGNDFIDAGGSIDRAFGGVGNDTIRGGSEADFLHGEAGNDTVQGGSEADTLRGGDGFDVLVGDDGNDLLQGQEGNDNLAGYAGNDLLQGGVGNDALDGGFGADTLLGEAGVDRLLGNAGNDRLYGGDDLDRLYGQDGNDLLFGGNGNDSLNGGAGRDILRGEAGNDFFFTDDNDVDSLLGHDGRDTADADRDDLLREIEVRS